jgi:hypothetical protein
MGPGLLLILLSSVHLSVQHWCDTNTCDIATDENNDGTEYSVEDPTAEERLICTEQTMIYVKDGERYCFLKDQREGKPAIQVSLKCSGNSPNKGAHPYECPNKEHLEHAWGYKEGNTGDNRGQEDNILTPDSWKKVCFVIF